MGPTNVALVKLFRADQALRDAQERLDAATKNVRLQERRANDAAVKLKTAQQLVKELTAKSANLDLDLRTRDAHIEKLRTQQQGAKNNKEYQAFLVEINTQKLDRAKAEEQAMNVLTELEKAQKEAAEAATALENEQAKLTQQRSGIGDAVANLQAEIDSLKVPREAAAAALPPKARDVFERLAEHHDGEAMSPILKPDRRKEEYACSACMMDLVTDVYNKLHTRDEMVFCPSCRRILFIPDDLPPELAVKQKKGGVAGSAEGESASETPAAAPKAAKPRSASRSTPRAKNPLVTLLTAAQGESVKNAVDAQQNAVEFQVTIDGKPMGVFKGKSGDNLERIIKFRMQEAKLSHTVHVEAVGTPAGETTPEAGGETAPAEAAGETAPPEPAGQTQPPAAVAEAAPVDDAQPSTAEAADSAGTESSGAAV